MRHETLHCLGPSGFHRIAYTEWGDPAAERVVVCAHGLTRNARDFDFLARRLARRWRVLCLDVVGRGRSEWLAKKADYGFDLYQSDAAALLARATAPGRRTLLAWLLRLLPGRARSVDWVGTSMGGIIGMLLAARAGSPIRRLVLNDVGATIPWSALSRMKGLMRRHEPFADMRAVVRHVREVYAGFGPLTDAQWRHLARHSVTRLKDGRYQLAYDPALEASLWNGSDLDMPIGMELVRGINLWRHWDAIRAPTLLLRGGDSDVLPRDVAREMLGRGPKAQLVEFQGIGHAPALMADDQIRAIERFLAA
ncbi:MAG TPA: alpha/beta hydrolase [Burkholderiales bacterium]|nr:alpha/beta hydrolase [Burkholderiales bacterium]